MFKMKLSHVLLVSGLSFTVTSCVAAPPRDASTLRATTHEKVAIGAPDGRPLQKSAMPIFLAKDGKAQLPIVIAPGASQSTKAVANELAQVLEKISGAKFEIKTGEVKNNQLPGGIVLGTLKEFPVASLNKPLEIHDLYDGREAFAIRSLPSKVLLIGATDLGASHAVYRFLELLGCRWFFMSPVWDVVPSIPNLQFDLNETTRPKVLARDIWFNYGAPPGQGIADQKAWARHNRMAQSFTIYVAHSYQNIVIKNKKEFDAHPEYYGLVNGKRTSWKMCLSNPAVRKMAVDYALDYLREYPEMDMVSMEPNDGLDWCECEECKKLGPIPDRAFGLSNEVARAVAKQFPGKMVGQLAYAQHADPPSFKLEPNVHIEWADGLNLSHLSSGEQFTLWPKYSDNRGIYEYFSLYQWGQERIRENAASGVASSVPGMTKKLRSFISWGMKSFSAESSCNFGKFGPGYYAALRVMWDEKTDVSALMDDFYDKAFGPAATPMKRYYERLDPASGRLFGRDLLARAYRDLDEASTLAKDRPDVQARLDQLKSYLHFNTIQWHEFRDNGDEAKKWALEKLRFVYRTRYQYIVHAVPLMQEAPDFAKKFNEPSWNLPNAPWRDDTPLTHDEIEKNFQEELQYFQPQEKIERRFSSEVVPVQFDDAPVADVQAAPSAPIPYTLVSLHGEPFKLNVNVAPADSRRLLHYTVKDSNERVIAEGDLTPDKVRKVYPLEIKVPHGGTYRFVVDRNDALLSFPPGTPAATELSPERPLNTYILGGAQQWYFYVPKGTKRLSFWQSGAPLQFFGPDGKLIREVKSDFDFNFLDVPAGFDGKLWRVSLRIDNLIFFNVPNWLALSPDQMLVPRDLAIADGLKIRQ
jgi:hypothetical protein